MAGTVEAMKFVNFFHEGIVRTEPLRRDGSVDFAAADLWHGSAGHIDKLSRYLEARMKFGLVTEHVLPNLIPSSRRALSRSSVRWASAA
jgi:hypothetical protein